MCLSHFIHNNVFQAHPWFYKSQDLLLKDWLLLHFIYIIILPVYLWTDLCFYMWAIKKNVVMNTQGQMSPWDTDLIPWRYIHQGHRLLNHMEAPHFWGPFRLISIRLHQYAPTVYCCSLCSTLSPTFIVVSFTIAILLCVKYCLLVLRFLFHWCSVAL